NHFQHRTEIFPAFGLGRRSTLTERADRSILIRPECPSLVALACNANDSRSRTPISQRGAMPPSFKRGIFLRRHVPRGAAAILDCFENAYYQLLQFAGERLTTRVDLVALCAGWHYSLSCGAMQSCGTVAPCLEIA